MLLLWKEPGYLPPAVKMTLEKLGTEQGSLLN